MWPWWAKNGSLHEFVEPLDVDLGQRGEQHRVAPVGVGALQRLVGGAAADLGERPPPPGR